MLGGALPIDHCPIFLSEPWALQAGGQNPLFPGPDLIYSDTVLGLCFQNITVSVARFRQVAPGQAIIPIFQPSNYERNELYSSPLRHSHFYLITNWRPENHSLVLNPESRLHRETLNLWMVTIILCVFHHYGFIIDTQRGLPYITILKRAGFYHLTSTQSTIRKGEDHEEISFYRINRRFGMGPGFQLLSSNAGRRTNRN